MSDTRSGPGDGVEQIMRDAGLPADTLAARRAALPLAVQEFHRRVLTAIGEAGKPPVGADLHASAAALGVDLRDALGALAAAEDRDGVLGGVPFAAAPTAQHVIVRGGPSVFANCAVDALGIGVMLGKDTDVASVDPLTGQPVTAAQRDGTWTWELPGAVVFFGSSGDSTITDSCCPVINFFATEKNARDHQRNGGLTGELLPMPEAARAGALVFGGLLAESTP